MLLVVGIQYLTKALQLCTCNSGRIYNHRCVNRRMLALEKPVWRKTTRLTSPLVRASVTSKVWRDEGRGSFCPPHSRRQKIALLAGWCAQQMNSYWSLARHSRFPVAIENQSTTAFFHLTRDWEFVSHWRRTACLRNKNRLYVGSQSNAKLRGLFLLTNYAKDILGKLN